MARRPTRTSPATQLQRVLHPPAQDGARPLADADFLCPVDGAISQFGPIERDQIFQAKGHSYSTTALVGGDRDLAARFENGSFATLYLSPRDYHRIHMPCDGKLTRMIYVPGRCSRSIRPRHAAYPACLPATSGSSASSTRPTALRADPGRCHHRRQHGHRLARRGQSAASGWSAEWRYDEQNVIAFRKAMGRFLLGSTVVMLFPKNALAFNPEWALTRAIRMGEAMGQRP